jgi:flagellar hook assembly protein FlgD
VPYPSPFNPKIQPVVIRYVLEKRSNVWINIYDMSRKIVKRVVEAEPRGPGLCEDKWYGVNFGGEQLANGVYFCEVIAKNGDGEARKYTALGIFGK